MRYLEIGHGLLQGADEVKRFAHVKPWNETRLLER